MNYFELFQKRNHEAVLFCSDVETGLRAIIAIHDVSLGPALGGCRMKTYATEVDALQDVLRLSRAMTYKASAAGLNLGGGKSVVLLNEGQKKTPELLKAFADRIQMLKGTYIGAGDVGSDTHDLAEMKKHCKWIVGLAKEDGGLGDSAILTSLGVFQGVRASVKQKLGRDSLDGVKVAIQGAGKVGFMLAERLLEVGAEVIISDPSADSISRVKEHFPAIKICAPEEIYSQDVDVFSPNAIGGLVTADHINNMKATIIAGGANNPFSEEAVGKLAYEKGILYAPDFVINAGGLIMVACEIEGLSLEDGEVKTNAIYDRTMQVFDYAKQKSLMPWEAARQLAVERIERTRAEKRHQLGLDETRAPVFSSEGFKAMQL